MRWFVVALVALAGVRALAQDAPPVRKVIVKFESQPAGATVKLDGDQICQATPCSKAVPEGPHEVVLELEKYAPATQHLEAAKGVTVSVTLGANFGWMRIDTDPPGVAVKVDGRAAGRTPIARLQADAGEHDVVADDPCWTSEPQHMTMSGGAEAHVTLALHPKTATLDVEAEDEKQDALTADVTVDGSDVGQAPGQFVVPACAKRLEARDSTGRRYELALSLREEQVLRVKARLSKHQGGKAYPSAKPPPMKTAAHPEFAVRAGLGGHVGQLGVGVEYRPGAIGFALGTGTYALSGGITLGSEKNDGGAYLDVHLTWSQKGLLGLPQLPGYAYGVTLGYDWRPDPAFSVKIGAGIAFNTARPAPEGKLPLAFDLALGPVF